MIKHYWHEMRMRMLQRKMRRALSEQRAIQRWIDSNSDEVK